MRRLAFLTILLLTFFLGFPFSKAQNPNILLVIADDLGVDYSQGYHTPALLPTTPTLDNLRARGITFENVFSSPSCTPSRATIMSGKFGIKTGVQGVPGHLDTSNVSIFRAIEAQTNGLYSDAVVGKWHISFPNDPFHPADHGVDYYSGLLSSSVSDYYSWDRTENGVTTTDTQYVTSAFTDASIDWIRTQTQPWFLWLAHVAPHSPFHEPPDSLYTITTTGNNRRKYVAMIEALDHELGRLLDSIPPNVLDSTLIIFVGDNGTPGNIIQDYPTGQAKGTVYQGGIRVPMIVAGAGVTRPGDREPALIHITDLYATLLEVVGANLPGGRYNSLSFKHLLDNSGGPTRDYNFSEMVDTGVEEYTVRGPRYKLIESVTTGMQQFYDLQLDSLETTDLIPMGLDPAQLAIKQDFEAEAVMIRTAWSCRDHIQNGDEEGIDCGGTYCAPCSTIGIANPLEGSLPIEVYPNPATDRLEILASSGSYSLELLDIHGICLAKIPYFQDVCTLDLEALPSGMYVLRLVDTENARVLVKKVMKR